MFDLRERKKRERVGFKNMKFKVICLESGENFCSLLDASRMGTSLEKSRALLMIHGSRTGPKGRQTRH